MTWSFLFFLNNILLGIGLAMDAFSISLANGLNEVSMSKPKMCKVAGTYAFFQAVMPMAGWICVHTIVEYFTHFQKFIPWIALVLLLCIGGKMIFESVKENRQKSELESEAEPKSKCLTFRVLMIQGIATSIDALSVGFTIADYTWIFALVASLIIAFVTFVVCLAGLLIGKRFGTKFADKAQIVGGLILIGIGIEIFVKGVFLS